MPMKILVADDSVTIQKVVEMAFSQRGVRVFSAGNGDEATARIREVEPDIVLLDVVMPGRDGYEICREVKQETAYAWVPVVLLAGSFEPFDESRAREAGADGSIRKPFQTRDLVTLVERLIASHPRPGGADEAVETPTEPVEAPAERQAEEPLTVMPPAELEMEAPGETGEPAPVAQAEAGSADAPPLTAPPAGDAATQDASGGSIQHDARAAVREVAESIVREIAWEVIPDLAEAIIRKRIQELEDDVDRSEGT